ncbi:MAG: hypothetical protein AB7L66_17240 [Gemmatimonadales bacterium]
MHDSSRVIMLEFNELSPSLMAKFIQAGQLPHFGRLLKESMSFVTDAEEKQEALEPWIQWVTMHTGLSYDQHGVFLLGDGHKCPAKRTWDLVSDEGGRVFVCGSMNLRYDRPLNGMVIPDPWTQGVEPQPADEFAPYLKFVTTNVREHTNSKVPLKTSDYLQFLRYMAGHGLSASTLAFIVRQQISERFVPEHKWRRAVILDRFQFDLFRHYYRQLDPHFATFFINSTAHFQHLYWRNMDPTGFKVQPSKADQDDHGGAVLYGYQQMDWIVGQVLAMAGNDRTIVFSSALGQQPCLKYEEQGGKVFYRPKDLGGFLRHVGLTIPHQVEPVMSEEFNLHFQSEADARAAMEVLDRVTVNGRPGLRSRVNGRDIITGCGIFEQIERNSTISTPAHPAPHPFFDLLYQAEGMKSGMHHPDGMFWIRRPGQAGFEYPGRVPLRACAPTILRELGVAAPASMTEPALPDSPRPLTAAGVR